MMMVRLLCGAAALLCVLTSASASDSKSWKLLHSLDNGESFSERATVNLGLDEEGAVEIKIENNEDCMSLDAVEGLSGLYQIKLIDDETKSTVISSVPACQVKRSNFRDEISVTLDSKANLLSLSYTPLVSPLAPVCSELPSLTEVPSFTSKISYETANPAMTIPLILPTTKPQSGLKFFPRQKGGQKVPGMEKEGGPEEATNPQSFIMRYWYIILPLFIMGLMGPQEEQGQQGQDGAQAPAAATAAAGGAAAAAAGSGGKQRRGKRG